MGAGHPGARGAAPAGEPTPELPRVAVLLATYNGARWLPELLASLAAQRGVAAEVFFADDGSWDDTVGVLRAARARLTLHEVVGPRAGTAARNFARLLTSVDLGGFDFVAFCDQDDVWLPGKLRRAVDVLTATGADCYASNLVAFAESGSRAVVRKDTPQRPLDYLFQSASAACTYVLRGGVARDLARLIGDSYTSWPDVTSFDCVVYAATRSRDLRWEIDGAAEILYRQHAANVAGANVGVRAFARRVAAVRRGWFREQVRTVARYTAPSPAVDAVVGRVQRGTWRDRAWLAAHAREFRREPRARLGLRLFFLLGWL